MVVLYAARHQLRVPALARWLLVLAIVATLAANLAHGPISAGWPADSLVGSYELLLWLIRTASTGATARRPGADPVDEPADQARTETGAAQTTRGQSMVHWLMADAAAQAAEREGGINAAAVAAYRASLDHGKPLSERKLAAMFGKTSRRWPRHRMGRSHIPMICDDDVWAALTTRMRPSCGTGRLNTR